MLLGGDGEGWGMGGARCRRLLDVGGRLDVQQAHSMHGPHFRSVRRGSRDACATWLSQVLESDCYGLTEASIADIFGVCA